MCRNDDWGSRHHSCSWKSEGLSVHKKVSKILDLKPVLISNQIVQRDAHAEFIMDLANIASTLEKMALEIRNLQRTELDEVGESFDARKNRLGPVLCLIK